MSENLIKLAGCAYGISCPAIYRKLAGCDISASCPAVYQTDDKIIVIGKLSDDPEILAKVGEGEQAVEISVELWDEAKNATIAEQAERIATLEAAVAGKVELIEPSPEAIKWAEGVFAEEDTKDARISALEAALGEAVEALEPFAKTAEQIDEVGNHAQVAGDDDVLCGGFKLSLPMIYLRKAKAVREKILAMIAAESAEKPQETPKDNFSVNDTQEL